MFLGLFSSLNYGMVLLQFCLSSAIQWPGLQGLVQGLEELLCSDERPQLQRLWLPVHLNVSRFSFSYCVFSYCHEEVKAFLPTW
jgi:hypothetical protein